MGKDKRRSNETIVVRWNQAALAAVRNSAIGPPMVARALAIVHTAMYDAWAAYHPVAVGTVLGDRLRQPRRSRTSTNKATAISYAAYRTLLDLFPSHSAIFNELMLGLGYDPTVASEDPHTATSVGTLAAKAVLGYRRGDGSNQMGDLHPGAYSDYTGYQPVNTPDEVIDPNRWQPLRVPDGRGGENIQRCLAPHWGLVRPFAMTSGAQYRPAPPRLLPQDREEYRKQSMEVLNYSANLTDAHKMIAEYWSDGPQTETPPGHWCLLAHFVSRRDRHNLNDDVKLFFMLGNALLDASICCWDTKMTYDYVRPITAIRYLYKGQKVKAWRGPGLGSGEVWGEEWMPYQPATFVTPPFGDFTSGHSTFSAAAAEVLRRFTRSDRFGYSTILPAGSSKIDPGVPRQDVTLCWRTFTEAADQAGLSRRYGGIHFAEADLVGRAMGRSVGASVFQRAQSFIQGQPL